MEIRKKDYSETEENIIQDLDLLGEELMVNWLTRNPAKKDWNNQLDSLELADRLKNAKEYARSKIDLLSLPSIQGTDFANLRQIIQGSPWKKQLKRD